MTFHILVILRLDRRIQVNNMAYLFNLDPLIKSEGDIKEDKPNHDNKDILS